MSEDMGDADPGMDTGTVHQPVLLAETVQHLSVVPGGVYLDATVGDGGHAAAILEASSPSGKVLGIDLDPRSLVRATQRLQPYGSRFIGRQGSYTGMLSLAQSVGYPQVNGVLMDLGFSARQVLEPGYGFSFGSNEPLDMRYDPSSATTAAHIVNTYSEEDLVRLIFRYGEEPRARAIARVIFRRRPITSTTQLADLVATAQGSRRGRRIHPATRTFQALRIAVNNELVNVADGLRAATQLLSQEGRLVVISYHSLEDRVVKTFLVRESSGCICPPEVPVCVCGHQPSLRLIQRRIIKPSVPEVQRNPRSRSARMRVAGRL
jgi:16S rRNA (cytosine1402-N4)-methyltransferase